MFLRWVSSSPVAPKRPIELSYRESHRPPTVTLQTLRARRCEPGAVLTDQPEVPSEGGVYGEASGWRGIS